MTASMRRRTLAGLAGAAVAASSRLAAAQTVAGGRAVRLVVPFPPGGAIDLLGRLVAERLTRTLGQDVVVDNRGGAGGILGADVVAKGPRDGSVVGLISGTIMTSYPFLYERLPFDPMRDLQPVCFVAIGALLCVVNAETAARRGWTDLRALIAWSRANPDRVRMGSSGPGTTSHLTLSALNRLAGARIVHVPYRGGAPAINDLLNGTIDMMFDVAPALMPHVESGRFKPLAVSSNARRPGSPDLPGMAEFADIGLGSLDIVIWTAAMTAGGTPRPVLDRLAQAIGRAIDDPAFAARLGPLGFDVMAAEGPDAVLARAERELPQWRRLVEMADVKLD